MYVFSILKVMTVCISTCAGNNDDINESVIIFRTCADTRLIQMVITFSEKCREFKDKNEKAQAWARVA